MMIRNWKNILFLGPMPGRRESLEVWLDEMVEHRIDRIVRLTSDEEVSAKSSEYATWLVNQIEYECIVVPIEDFGVPDGDEVAAFWDAAFRVAEMIRDDTRVFVHCGAGIGRTGTFATAVLMCLGHDHDDAVRKIREAGSAPDTEEQRQLLVGGPPAHMKSNRAKYGFEWTIEQKRLTLDVLDHCDPVAFTFSMTGKKKGCPLIHLDQREGYITLQDALAYRWRVFDEENDELIGEYGSSDDLVNDGWKVTT